MDQRHEQIREGAGLEESRINTEFVDLIKKWSTPVLFVAAAIAFGYLMLQKLEERRVTRVDQAFVEMEQARSSINPSPDSLLRLADDYSDIRAVAPMARLAAADIYLESVVLAIEPGAPVTYAGVPENESDRLTEESRSGYLARADEIYNQVVTNNAKKSGREVMAIEAMYGVAAVAEMRHDRDAAVAAYEKLIVIADGAGFPVHAANAQARIDTIDEAVVEVVLMTTAELPQAPIPGVLSGSLPGIGNAADVPIAPVPEQDPAPDGPEQDDADPSDADEPAQDEPDADEPPADPGQ